MRLRHDLAHARDCALGMVEADKLQVWAPVGELAKKMTASAADVEDVSGVDGERRIGDLLIERDPLRPEVVLEMLIDGVKFLVRAPRVPPGQASRVRPPPLIEPPRNGPPRACQTGKRPQPEPAV